MRTLLTAVALATILTTPALANKTIVKPVDTCATDKSYTKIMYHLDRIEALLDKMEAEAKLVDKKSVKDVKTSG